MKRTQVFIGLSLALAAIGSYAAPSVQTKTTWGLKCDHSPAAPGMAPLVAILAPFVIDAVVDHAAASIKAASDSEAKQFPATSEISKLYEVNRSGELNQNKSTSCLNIVRGEFEEQKIKKEYLRLEIALTPIDGTDYFRLEPQFFKAEKLETGNWFSKTGDYSIEISLYGFGNSTPFGSATFTFEKIKDGTEMKLGDYRLISANSDPIQYPTDLEDAKAAQEKLSKKAAPYLLALGALKNKQRVDKLKMDNEDAILTSKANQYDVAAVSVALKKYCVEEGTFNSKLPEKSKSRSEICAIAKNSAKRELDRELSNTDLSIEVQSWARGVCKDWNQKNACNKKFDDSKESLITESFISKTIITETRDANVYGQKLAAILGKASDDIKNELKSKLPDAKEKAEEQKDSDNRKAEYQYSLALSKLKVAQNNYNITEDQEKLEAHIKVVEACYIANEAAISVGKVTPCPQYE